MILECRNRKYWRQKYSLVPILVFIIQCGWIFHFFCTFLVHFYWKTKLSMAEILVIWLTHEKFDQQKISTLVLFLNCVTSTSNIVFIPTGVVFRMLYTYTCCFLISQTNTWFWLAMTARRQLVEEGYILPNVLTNCSNNFISANTLKSSGRHARRWPTLKTMM